MYTYWKRFKSLSLCSLLALPLVACASSPAMVKPGDSVKISFTCRLPGGELAATTSPDSSLSGEAKAPVYLPCTKPGTITVTAGIQAPDKMQDRLPFELEIKQRLAPTIPGMKEGEQATRTLEAERYPVTASNKRIIKMAKVRKRQKEMRLTREEYTGRTGKTPKLGDPLVLDPMVPGTLSEVTDQEVVVRFAPVPGKELTTPFGPVVVRELADSYELEITAEKGRLIRTGPMAGRITDVDKESITVDFGHPFAGEKLNCEVEVVQIEPRQPKEISAPAASPDQRAGMKEAL